MEEVLKWYLLSDFQIPRFPKGFQLHFLTHDQNRTLAHTKFFQDMNFTNNENLLIPELKYILFNLYLNTDSFLIHKIIRP